ncbi:hypothetical protein NDU88_006966 [Pleurodeles waltl]|uniref:Uncharacterized protein n=1 Tax=Pleurodeles waltl TaxID=8319 RepID=A0AAV7LRY8_PLEWA|nr:hypothetical protein NDU88_006966 [Pleurodeles waltl]
MVNQGTSTLVEPEDTPSGCDLTAHRKSEPALGADETDTKGVAKEDTECKKLPEPSSGDHSGRGKDSTTSDPGDH